MAATAGSLCRDITLATAQQGVHMSAASRAAQPLGLALSPGRRLDAVCSAYKGDAPGRYGGPPLDTKIRKTYGGGMKDPITSTDEYIWNTNWKKRLDDEAAKKEAEEKAAAAAAVPEASGEQGSGFLSIGRSLALDSLEVDLSKELSKPSQATMDRQLALARQAPPEETKSNKIRWRYAPTTKEAQAWEKQSKYLGGSPVPSSGPSPEQIEAAREESIRNYYKLKGDLLRYTILIGAACAASAYFTYSPEVSASYGIGVLGSLIYVRMLGNSVDSLGAGDMEGRMRGALGSPRLLVPVVLVLAFNRWNKVLAPEYGLLELQLIPILVGFFTYKAGTLVQVFAELLESARPSGEKSQ